MRPNFEKLVRFSLFTLVALLGWSIWVGAQEPATNAAPRLENLTTAAPPAGAPKPAAPHAAVTFGLDRIPLLSDTEWLGEPLWKYLASLIYLVLAFGSAKLIDWLISGRLKKWTAKTETQVDDLLLELIHGPIKIVSIVVFLHIGLRVFEWPGWVEDYLSKALRIIVAWSLTYMVLRAVDLLVEYWRRRVASDDDKAFNDQFVPIIRKTMKIFIIVVVVLLVSQNLGLNITSLLASLSVGGLALGLAAQDTVANLFGAVAIFIDKPFRIGDRIKLDAVDGVVESIGLRSTRVRNLEGYLITIPNKTMGGATITNISRRPNIKTEINIGLTCDTPPDRVKRALMILEDIFKSNPMTFDVQISFNKFADSALNIQVVHWWNSTDYPAYLAGMQQMNFAIMQRFAAEKISMAFPSQTLYVKQDSDWRFGGAPPTGGRAS
jgi:MscS family membrane protein